MHLAATHRAYLRRAERRLSRDDGLGPGELNITPLLDIVVNVIVFLLATVATMLATTQITSNAPGFGPHTAPAPLGLTVTVGRAGFYVAGAGGMLAPGCRDVLPGGTRQATIAGRDFAALGECAARLKDRFPDETQAIVSADADVPYADVVATMDALRADALGARGGRALFPEVLIAAGLR